MLSVASASKKLIAEAQPLVSDRRRAGLESAPVHEALGRVVAADIVAAVDVPPAANSAMDGYAYCAADAAANKYRLALSQRIPAGAAPAPLEPGTVARIFTGGEIPAGRRHCGHTRKLRRQRRLGQARQKGRGWRQYSCPGPGYSGRCGYCHRRY
jgi:molybdopterin biosynthesis enzyme